jgi:hypothetical protein
MAQCSWRILLSGATNLLEDNMKSKAVVTLLAISALVLGSACSSSVKVGPDAVAGLMPDGTVDMEQVQVAYIGDAGGGGGTLYYRGTPYRFKIGGLGVGGIGASTVDAEGEVYKLHNLSQFAGSYAQASYGFVIGTKSAGDLWMQNEAGVIMHLKAKRTGLMLSLGGDAAVISMRRTGGGCLEPDRAVGQEIRRRQRDEDALGRKPRERHKVR